MKTMLADAGGEHAFVFGPFRMIPSRHLLVCGERPVRLGGRALDLLHILLAKAGEEVSKSALMNYVWPDVSVDEVNLKVHISSIRRALEDSVPRGTYVATVPGRGYKFVGQVTKEAVSDPVYGERTQSFPSELPACPVLIEREQENATIQRALDTKSLVTITGSAGVGKTGVALALAHSLQDSFPDGVHYLDLASLEDARIVPELLAKRLHRRPPGTKVLVVLDHCEHVVQAVANAVVELRKNAFQGRVIAISREPLGTYDEHIVCLRPLAYPLTDERHSALEALRFPAVKLFALCARKSAGYELQDADTAAVIELCQMLDGIPLAIELAAAHLVGSGPAQMLASFDPRLFTRAANRSKKDVRQSTLKSTLDWSYRLLSREQAAVFRFLGLFAGAFEWPDVAALSQLLGYSPFVTTTALGALVSKSLVQAEFEGDQLRYKLLLSSRECALEYLQEDPYWNQGCMQHAQTMLGHFQKAEAEWGWVDPVVWRRRYGWRAADLRKALDWCFGPTGDASLGISLCVCSIRFWNEQSSVLEQITQIERALSVCPSVPGSEGAYAQLTVSAAWGLVLARRLDQSTRVAWERALRATLGKDDASLHIQALCGRVIYLAYVGCFAEALADLDELGAYASCHNETSSLFDEARLRAFVRVHQGDLSGIQEKLESLSEELSSGVAISPGAERYRLQRYVSVRSVLAFSLWLTGQTVRAISVVDDLLDRTTQGRQLLGRAHVLALFALPIALSNGDVARVARYVSMLDEVLQAEGILLWKPVLAFYEAALKQMRSGGAIESLKGAINQLRADKFLLRVPFYLSHLADCLLSAGDVDGADEAITQALQCQRVTGENWCYPELLRISAKVSSRRGDHSRAKATLTEVRKSATASGMLFASLRSVNDLAAHALERGNKQEAYVALNEMEPYVAKMSETSKDVARYFQILDSVAMS